MDDQDRYVACLLDRYRRVPGTLGHILNDDRRTARHLYQRHVAPDLIEQAFLLAVARRRSGAKQPSPIRSLRYFLPLIEEIAEAPLPPDYLHYLRTRCGDQTAYLTTTYRGRRDAPPLSATAPITAPLPLNVRTSTPGRAEHREKLLAD